MSRRDACPTLIFRSESPFLRLYHGNCLELLDAIAAKYPEGRFDAIFADPPYFLSNGGITCHAGRMVKLRTGRSAKQRTLSGARRTFFELNQIVDRRGKLSDPLACS